LGAGGQGVENLWGAGHRTRVGGGAAVRRAGRFRCCGSFKCLPNRADSTQVRNGERGIRRGPPAAENLAWRPLCFKHALGADGDPKKPRPGGFSKNKIFQSNWYLPETKPLGSPMGARRWAQSATGAGEACGLVGYRAPPDGFLGLEKHPGPGAREKKPPCGPRLKEKTAMRGVKPDIPGP